ncbi:MAG TPA: hypothetical protein VGT08_08505 [Terracidiphilus sp.]|nr:hypothetical protein [Terracidiphilus sp.]
MDRGKELADWEVRQWAEIQEMVKKAKVAQTQAELAPTGQTPVKRERRAQERRAVDTTVTIFLIKAA